eukprot:COSAG01_NODE_30967_length_606_cov_0.966469_2_plen_62_part_01
MGASSAPALMVVVVASMASTTLLRVKLLARLPVTLSLHAWGTTEAPALRLIVACTGLASPNM